MNINRARNVSKTDISNCMFQRAEYILKVAIINDVKNLILGAWGCGVFRNSPKDISEMFRYLLFEKDYIKCFNNISFAVYGRNLENYNAFEQTFKQFLY